jgi:hypothetical protein
VILRLGSGDPRFELTWFSPLEARDPAVLTVLMQGRVTLLLQALAHLGV